MTDVINFVDASVDLTIKLDSQQRQRLKILEDTIERNLKGFYEVGMALAEIKSKFLYRETHQNFEDYCRDRWEMSRIHAFRLIESAKVQKNLLPIGNTPSNEAQTRPLTKLNTPELQQEAWQQVIETAPEGKVTARHVAKVVSEIKGDEVKKHVKQTKKKIEREVIPEAFRKAYDEYYGRVQNAKMEKWRNVSQ